MKIIICLDKKNGYMFNNRRQSMDRVLRQKLLLKLDGKPLYMSEYTKRQFTEEGNFFVDDEYEKNANADDFCFIENKGYNFSDCDEVWLFRWDKNYPADKIFDFSPEAMGFSQVSVEVFSGSSHDEISFEIYKRRIEYFEL